MASEIRGVLRVNRFARDEEISSLSAFCPACDFEHSFNVDLTGHGKWAKGPCWSFDGNYDKPTFNPSMGFNLCGQVKHHPVCHSFLRNGQWHYLNDSTHAMAGQTVDVPPVDPDMTFQRCHGWHLFPWCDDNGEPLKDWTPS